MVLFGLLAIVVGDTVAAMLNVQIPMFCEMVWFFLLLIFQQSNVWLMVGLEVNILLLRMDYFKLYLHYGFRFRVLFWVD